LRSKNVLLKTHKGSHVPVKFHVEGRISVVTLSRPERLNAISSALLDGFMTCLDQAEASAADVILLQAEGRAFCAGDDLVELAAKEPTVDYATDFVARLQDVSRKLMFGSKPVICAAQGYIVGGGAAWPLNADFSILADDAILFCPETGWGMFPSGGVTALLPACCGPVRANEIIWRGVRVSSAQLVVDGIAGQSVPAAELADAARALANEIADLPEASRRRMKELRTHQWRERIETAMTIESRYCFESALDPSMRAKVQGAQA
jgi:enoyl-CoA hydratase/carnithine racemase